MLNSVRFRYLVVILASVSVPCFAGVVDDGGKVIKTVTGRMYMVQPETGRQHRLTRRHIETDTASPKAVKLVLESDDNDIEMTLFRKSVWAEDSKAFVRYGEVVVEVPIGLDSSCFLTGELSSGEGSASFYNCEGFSGFIQTPEMDYQVEQSLNSDDDSITDGTFADVTVTMVKPESIESSGLDGVYGTDDDDEDNLDVEEEEERIFFENTTSTERTKRRSGDRLTAEVSVFADKIYADYLKSVGKGTLKKATAHFVNKWNTIAGVYGNRAKVGLEFDIQLKHVEIWWKNPSFYLRYQTSDDLGDHLHSFCSGTRKNKADHRMLYTVGYGGGVMGLATVGGVCTHSACSAVKSKTSNVRVELHEFGHSIGFHHEPKMLPCSKPWGFMGWDQTYKFNDCYKRYLLKNYKNKSYNCLRHVNMKEKALN